jgi:hypothetical protein
MVKRTCRIDFLDCFVADRLSIALALDNQPLSVFLGYNVGSVIGSDWCWMNGPAAAKENGRAMLLVLAGTEQRDVDVTDSAARYRFGIPGSN